MTVKQRLLNSIKGDEVDRIPFSPFLAYYFEHLPKEVQAKGQLNYLKEINADPLLRGFVSLFDVKYNGCEHSVVTKGEYRYTKYETKHGNLEFRHKYSPGGDSWFLIDHPVKDVEGLKTLQYIYENMTFEDKLCEFEAEYNKLGEDALILPVIGAMGKTSFQSLVEHWCGTEDLTYLIYDNPDEVAQCLSVMKERDRQTVNIAAKSCADGFIFWEDSSTTNINPGMFLEYTRPEIDEWADILHGSDKFLVHHACGHLKDLMPGISGSRIDALESLSPPPTGNIELFDAREKLRDDIAIIGGIEPVFLLESSMEELREKVVEILERMKGSRYILANSDSCPPFVEVEKFRMIAELVRTIR